MKPLRPLAAAAFVLASAAAGGTPLSGAKLEKSASDLAGAVRAAASGKGPEWIGYSVPAVGSHHVCCGWNGSGPCGTGGCALDSASGGFSISDDSDCHPDAGALGVFLKIGRDGRTERVRLFSESCAVDAAGLSIAWLDRVAPAESVAFLESLTGEVPAHYAPPAR